MQQFVYKIRISTDTTDERWLAALRHELEVHGGKGLGGIGRMRTVKQAHQYAVFLTMLDVEKTEQRFGPSMGCGLQGFAFVATPSTAAFSVVHLSSRLKPVPDQNKMKIDVFVIS